MRRGDGPGRAGVGLIIVLVALAVLALLLSLIAVQVAGNRRELIRREYRLQARWLARAGLALAAEKLQADPKNYSGEAAKILPDAKVAIRVRREKDVVEVVSEATYPTDIPRPVVHTLRRRFRPVEEKGSTTRLQPLPPGPDEPDDWP